MGFMYDQFIRLYSACVRAAAPFNQKARLWKEGRKHIFAKLENAFQNNSAPVIWMHCASLGEFEQGRPVLESLRKEYPNHRILLTFFSPSGYEIRKNYNGADWVFYLPLDTPGNVKNFLNAVNPSLAIFVKYEYWYNYLNELQKRKIPTILISAIFRKDKIFFKWYGGLHRQMLNFFDHIFVQDQESAELLKTVLPKKKVSVAGDTRFDRVAEIASRFESIKEIEKFIAGKKILVAGSTWPDDEKNLKIISEKFQHKISLIIAPHEINDSHINFLKSLFPEAILFSELLNDANQKENILNIKTLIINNIGMLSKLYYYADICYIGGGFNSSGIHNTLESAVYSKPVIFGPNYQKFSEAVELIKKGGGFTYNTELELFKIFKNILEDDAARWRAGAAAGKFVIENTGASQVVLSWLRKTAF